MPAKSTSILPPTLASFTGAVKSKPRRVVLAVARILSFASPVDLLTALKSSSAPSII
ncbi:hypothetical protein D3C71_1948970 [compost metagenome]